MTLRTHNSQHLRTSTPTQGNGIQGSVTVSISVSATLTRERTISSNVTTRVYPVATTEYSEPGVGDIIISGIVNTTQFGNTQVEGGSIVVAFTGFTSPFVVNTENVVGREFGVVEGWHDIDPFENPPATFGDFLLIQDHFISFTGFDGSEEEFPNQFTVIWDVTYDLDVNIDASGNAQFGDLEAFFGLVENNWIEDEPLDPNPWGRIT